MAELDDFRSRIVSWGNELLRPYLEQLDYIASAGPRSTSPKEFNDPIWGTIRLRPLEIALIDSPLLQRLRQIRQLGVIHLVYPAAGHTRFEHTLGSILQVTRVVESLNEHAGRELVGDQMLKLLRLTALCHDIGHGAMSHVSENALRNFDEVERLRLEFVDSFGGARASLSEKASLSEIAAYCLVGSEGFSRLLEKAQSVTNDHDLPENAIELMRNAIVGSPISEKIPLLHELISGPFDADKLDYMTRDAQMTGVPVVTDIPRLIQKVRAVEMSLEELPEKVQKLVTVGSGPSYWLTGIAVSGGRTLDELLIGRIMLFDKLYRHHKVRACEAMVAAIYRAIGALHPDGPAMLPYHLDDAQTLELNESAVRAVLGRDLGAEESERVRIAADMAARLKARRLFVRAYAFAQVMPLDPYRSEHEHASGLRTLTRVVGDQQRRGELVDAIVEELGRVIELLGREDVVRDLPTADLKPYIWIDPPEPPSETTDVAQAFLITDDRNYLRFREDYAEAVSWTNAYLLTRDVGYVFTTAELAPFVFVAVERVLRTRFGIRSPRSMYQYAKQSGEVIDAVKRELAERDYYESLPYDLRPLPEALLRGDVRGALDRVAARLHAYEGPVETPGEEHSAPLVNRERMIDWLRQFDSDLLIDGGLRALEAIQFFGRQELIAALDALLSSDDRFRNGSIAALGEPKDSSAVLVYHALDLQEKHGLQAATLVEAIALRRPIVFVDDFIGAGSQSISIVEGWLGVEPTRDLHEVRGEALSEDLQQSLRETPLAFVFSAGLQPGVDELRARAHELGLDATVYTHTQALPSVLDPSIYESERQATEFIERCREVGASLLAEDEKREDRALGYGNLGLLVVFPYNTPAQTATCLWSSGVWKGVPWEPLLPRRRKR